jgi:hypothetical protein
MAKYFDISLWEEKNQYQTGGTRSKCIVQHPETFDLYFFKTSIKNEGKDFKHEFWSEIIASEVGLALGFNMLVYDIAHKNGEVGCLSKSMRNINTKTLNEGVKYLQGYNPSYNPKDKKKSYDAYTFHFIRDALKSYSLENKISDLIKTIIFDSLIGNGDRHQENWAFILINNTKTDKDYNQALKIRNRIISKSWFKLIVKFIFFPISLKLSKKGVALNTIFDTIKGTYSPIYDSGSCLGREIEDDKIDLMLRDNNMLQAYINRGTSEIRWDGPKINHFKLIEKIKSEYNSIVTNEITRVTNCFDENKISQIICDIDKNLHESLKEHKLPQNRKELIIKMITLRSQKLKEVIKK